jgi:hypothetical protein
VPDGLVVFLGASSAVVGLVLIGRGGVLLFKPARKEEGGKLLLVGLVVGLIGAGTCAVAIVNITFYNH